VPHTFECELRWADMDQLRHVNNVRYIGYVAAARRAMFEEVAGEGVAGEGVGAEGSGAGQAPVSRHRVEFAAPLVFRRRPVHVDSWVTGVTDTQVALAHEVYDDEESGRTVYLRVSSVLEHALDDRERALAESLPGAEHSWRALPHTRRPARAVYAAQVRPTDLDERAQVSDTALFELLQEARVQYLMNLHTRGQDWTQHVVARTDVHYRRAIPFRTAPYEVHSWVGELGNRSFTICAEVRDGETVLAEATVAMVTFDPQTQRSAEMAPTQRDRLQAELGQPAATAGSGPPSC
jgi:acyl-CoA thioester hydrolase